MYITNVIFINFLYLVIVHNADNRSAAANFGVKSRRDNRVYKSYNVFGAVFTYFSFGGVFNAESVGF